MSKTLILRDEIFEYPDTGDINYGEEATGWAEEATDILGEVSGPGDIPTTEVSLVGTDNGTYIEGIVTGLLFDTSYVQSMQITGFLTRTYTDSTPTQVEAFTIDGAYNGTVINFSTDFSGDDAELEFTVSGGQFGFSYLKIHPDQVTDDLGGTVDTTDQVIIKFSAKAKIDEDFFS